MRKVYEVTLRIIVVSHEGQGDPRCWDNDQLLEDCLELSCSSQELVPAPKHTNQPTTKEASNADA